MKEIRFCNVSRYVYDVPSFLKYLHIDGTDIAKNFNFILDEENPEYLFANEVIYTTSSYLKKFKSLFAKNPITIFFAGEALYPDLNMFDYAIAMNRKLIVSDRISRLPTNIFYEEGLHDKENNISAEQAKSLLHKDKQRFCSFIYSNGRAHPFRDKLFQVLSEYKHVESLGPHLNNIGTLIGGGRHVEGWQELSVKIKSKYKFVIACENACFEGYISEKLLTSFQAHTVPIYWGDKDAALEYNPEAFINCNDYDSLDSLVKRIKEVDEDDNLWAHIVSQPWQTESQKNYSAQEYRNYINFMTNIFSQPIEKAIRRPQGTWPDFLYRSWFLYRQFMGGLGFFGKARKLMQYPQRLRRKIKRAITPVTDINEFFND